jgi:hypothetical protein
VNFQAQGTPHPVPTARPDMQPAIGTSHAYGSLRQFSNLGMADIPPQERDILFSAVLCDGDFRRKGWASHRRAVGSIFMAQHSITLQYGLLEQGRHVQFGNGEILEGVAES